MKKAHTTRIQLLRSHEKKKCKHLCDVTAHTTLVIRSLTLIILLKKDSQLPTPYRTVSTKSKSKPYTLLLTYSTSTVGPNSSLMLLTLTNLDSKLALPALSFVPDALAPPNGCCPTTAPVDLQLR